MPKTVEFNETAWFRAVNDLPPAASCMHISLGWTKKPLRISEFTYLPGVKLVSTKDGSPLRVSGPEHWHIIEVNPFDELPE